MHQRIWILVSDASRAKLFQHDGSQIVEVGDFTHAAESLPVRKQHSARPRRQGKESSDWGDLGRTAVTHSKETEAEKFARELAVVLNKGLDEHHFESLEVMAPRHFQGLLRKFIDPKVAKRLTASFDQDFIDL